MFDATYEISVVIALYQIAVRIVNKQKSLLLVIPQIPNMTKISKHTNSLMDEHLSLSVSITNTL